MATGRRQPPPVPPHTTTLRRSCTASRTSAATSGWQNRRNGMVRAPKRRIVRHGPSTANGGRRIVRHGPSTANGDGPSTAAAGTAAHDDIAPVVYRVAYERGDLGLAEPAQWNGAGTEAANRETRA